MKSEHVLIHDLDRRRRVSQYQRGGRQGFEQAAELDDERGPGARQLDQLQLGLDGDAKGPLRADEQPGEVEVGVAGRASTRGNKRVEVVPADAPENLGEAAVDLLGVLGGQAPGDHGSRRLPDPPGRTWLRAPSRSSGFKCTRLPSDKTVFSSST